MKKCSWMVFSVALGWMVWVGLPRFFHTTQNIPLAFANPPSSSMTLKDVLLLFEVGYKEADILAEIHKNRMAGKFALTPAEVLQLRKAGASLDLIRAMGIRQAKPAVVIKPVSFQELQDWLQQKKAEDWIRKQLQQRGIVAEQFTMTGIVGLRKQGMSVELLRFVVQLKKAAEKTGVPGKPVVPGTQPPPTDPPQRVPEPTTPVVPRTLLPDLSVPGTKRPTPPVDPAKTVPLKPVQTTRWGVRATEKKPLTDREKQSMERQGQPLLRAKDGIFVHDSGHYKIQVPQGWQLLRDIHPVSGEVRILFSPEQETQVTKLQQAVWIGLEHISLGDRTVLKRAVLQTARFLMQSYLKKEPDVKEKEPIRSVTWQGIPAVKLVVEGKAREDVHTLQKQVYLLRVGNVYVQIGLMAPPEKMAAFLKSSSGLLKSLVLEKEQPLLPGTRTDQAIPAQKIIQTNMPGVVSIMCMQKVDGKLKPASSGSGFVVTPDGYVLTNHHVAVNSQTGKPYDVYYLNWDATTQRKFVKARYIGGHMQQAKREQVRMIDSNTGRISVRFQQQHVDIALLKIDEPGIYPTVQLSAIKHAMLGDPIIAMGFPSEGASINTMGNESITTTMGSISRIVRMADQRVNEIQHSAKVAGGNSGGPLFDVHTGAVIGINTWVGVFDKRLPRPGMGLGYYYAIPIDLAWQYFPDYIDPKARTRTPEEWYEWGLQWLAKQQWSPARRAFQRVIQAKPQMAVAYLQLAHLYLERATQFNDDQRHEWLKLSRRWADLGLRQDLNHPTLMTLLARVSIEREDWNTASYLLQQLLEQQPHDWQIYVLRSLMYKLQNKTDQALEDARKVIELAGKFIPTGHLLRGAILYGASRFFEGQQSYRQALQIEPDNLTAQIQEALGYTNLKQFDDAMARLQLLAQKHEFEPSVYQALMVTRVMKKEFAEAWQSFDMLWRSAMLRHQGVDVISLYLGGLLAERVLSEKIRDRLKWGLWGAVIGQHNLSPTAQRVGLMLSAAAYQSQRPGLAYGIFQRIQRPIQDKDLKKLEKTLSQRLQRQGISQQAWLYIATQAYPNWSPALVWDLFQHTPSLLELETAKAMAKKGFPVTLLVKMLRVSAQRKKQGMSGTSNQPTQQQPTQQQGGMSYQQHRNIVVRVVYEAFRALRESNAELWLSLHDPTGNRQAYSQQFWYIVSQIQAGAMSLQSDNPPVVEIKRHPTLGLVALYYFNLRVGSNYSRRYWQLRLYYNRWVMY